MIGELYSSPSNFYEITRTIFGVIIIQDFAAPFLQNDAFDLQTGRPVLTNGKHPQSPSFPVPLVKGNVDWA